MILTGQGWIAAGGLIVGLIFGMVAVVLLRRRRVILRTEQQFSTHFMYSGNLGQTNLLDAIQFLELGNREGILHLYAGSDKGYLVFQDGHIIDAFFQNTCGKGAVFQMLELDSGDFYFESRVIRQPRIIVETMMDIALEWDALRSGTATDEESPAPPGEESGFQSLHESPVDSMPGMGLPMPKRRLKGIPHHLREKKDFPKMNDELKIFSGNANIPLAESICRSAGVELGRCEIVKFSNENIKVKIAESVRGKDVFVIQPSCSPVNDGIMELLIMIDAIKHASAGRITAVLPYYPYARSDKKDEPRISITARLMADLLQTAGANRIVTMNLHSPQIQGFFRIPVDHLLAGRVVCDYFQNRGTENCVVVAPDAGSAKRAGHYAIRLGLPAGDTGQTTFRRFGGAGNSPCHRGCQRQAGHYLR